MMKRFFLMFAVFGLLFACTPKDKNNNGGNQNDSEGLTTTGEAIEVTDFSATLTGYANLPLEFGNAEVGIMYDKVQSFESAEKAVATRLDGDNKYTVTATGLEPSTMYYYKSYVQNGMAIKYGSVKSFNTKIYTAIDLGLSVKWAPCNLGASEPWEYGGFYAWGETETKTDYSWETYKWCNGSYDSLTKYNTSSSFGAVDNKTVLDPEDDVAHVKLGGKWRMPTDDEWGELRDNCIWEWTTMNGVNGYRVTSKKTGYTDRWIFLPAAGYRRGTSLSNAGSYGYYWYSSLYTDVPSIAYYLLLDSSYVGRHDISRYYGPSVRPVSE